MNCEDVSIGLIAYLDGRADSDRRAMDEHLEGCASCQTRVAEFREISNLLGEVPAIEPSFGFDARVRQRVAAEPRRRWLGIFAPQPPRVFASVGVLAVLVLVLTFWAVKIPANHPGQTAPVVATQQQEDFNAIKNLGVLENYDVLTQFDALSAGASGAASQSDKTPQGDATAND